MRSFVQLYLLAYKSSLKTALICVPCRVVSVWGTACPPVADLTKRNNLSLKQVITPSSLAFSFTPRKLSMWRLKLFKLFNSSRKEILERKLSITCEFRQKLRALMAAMFDHVWEVCQFLQSGERSLGLVTKTADRTQALSMSRNEMREQG